MSRVIAVVDDLLFLSRIREAAKGAGVEVVSARDAATLVASAPSARLVLVDADSDRLPWREAVAALRATPGSAELPIVAFLSHLAVERAAGARAAGIERVLARSAFVRELPGLLATASAGLSGKENP